MYAWVFLFTDLSNYTEMNFSIFVMGIYFVPWCLFCNAVWFYLQTHLCNVFLMLERLRGDNIFCRDSIKRWSWCNQILAKAYGGYLFLSNLRVPDVSDSVIIFVEWWDMVLLRNSCSCQMVNEKKYFLIKSWFHHFPFFFALHACE